MAQSGQFKQPSEKKCRTLLAIIILQYVAFAAKAFSNEEILGRLKRDENSNVWPPIANYLLAHVFQERLISKNIWLILNPDFQETLTREEFLDRSYELPAIRKFSKFFFRKSKFHDEVEALSENEFSNRFMSFLVAQNLKNKNFHKNQTFSKVIQNEKIEKDPILIEGIDCGDLLLHGEECVPCTETNQFADFELGHCFTCDPSTDCVKCHTKSSCALCAEGAVLLNGKCQKTCEAGCKDCLEGECKECNDGFEYDSLLRKCISCSSKPGTLFNSTTKKCDNCSVKNCETCLNASSCAVCAAHLFLTPDKMSCVLCNKTGELRAKNVQGIRVCGKCLKNCQKCSKANTCKLCQTGYYLKDNNKTCSKCNEEGFFVNKKESKCEECGNFCSSCSDKNNCSKCSSGYYLGEDGFCSLCSDSGSFKTIRNDTNVCAKCGDNCTSCEAENACLDCLVGFANIKGQCEKCDKLPGYYIDDSGTCQACSTGCKECQTAETCLECHTSFFKTNGTCVKCDMPGVFIKNNRTCEDCSENCEKCFSEKECIKCKDPFVINDPERNCVTCLEPGFYVDSNADIGGRVCKKCIENCSKCKSSQTCELCNENYFLLGNNKCTVCKDPGFIIDGTSCHNCGENCKECKNNNDCKTCLPDHYLRNGDCVGCNDESDIKLGAADGTGTCQTGCSNEGEFLVTNKRGKKWCKKCASNCKLCLNKNTCKECQPTYFVKEGKCGACNGPGEYELTDENYIKHCKTCAKHCQSCATETTCLKCSNGFFVDHVDQFGACVKCNQTGRFVHMDVYCMACPVNCHKCSKHNDCTHCSPGFLLEGSKCVKKCEEANSFPAKDNNGLDVCTRCALEHCSVCESLEICLRCNSNALLLGRECVYCLENFGYYLNEKNTCSKCPPNCKKCHNSTVCAEPSENYFLQKGRTERAYSQMRRARRIHQGR